MGNRRCGDPRLRIGLGLVRGVGATLATEVNQALIVRPAYFACFIREDVTKWPSVVKTAGAKVD